MTKDQEFKQEFFALLRKYNAEMNIREHTRSYNTYTEGVTFSFNQTDWSEPSVIDLDLYTWEDGKEFV